MAGRLLALNGKLLRISNKPCNIACMSDIRSIVGNRDIVGYGFNGQPNYVDRPDFPLPAVRWRENTPDIIALREKEKGDWNKLSKEEKKALYRASFRQTFSEFQAPSGEWKSVLGIGLMLMSLSFWIFYGMKTFVYPELPESFSEENRKAQLRRIIDLQVNPVQGLSSQWDYEKDDWKK